MRILTIIATLGVAACAGGGTTATPSPTERPTPEPTPTAWQLEVVDTVYDTEVSVGDDVLVSIEIENTGTKASPLTHLNFSELDKNADLLECAPACQIDDLPGFGPSALMDGIPAGETKPFHVTFVAREVGVVRWQVCLYDQGDPIDDLWCGDATTTIR